VLLLDTHDGVYKSNYIGEVTSIWGEASQITLPGEKWKIQRGPQNTILILLLNEQYQPELRQFDRTGKYLKILLTSNMFGFDTPTSFSVTPKNEIWLATARMIYVFFRWKIVQQIQSKGMH